VVAVLSKSQTSISGPAAGLAATVGTYFAAIGNFQGFLAALVIGGLMQIVLGIVKFGIISNYFPSSVILGLLASIGILLIFKQLPHAIGDDLDAFGDFSFAQADGYNTFSELLHSLVVPHYGAILVTVLSIGLLIFWNKVKALKNSFIPGPLVVVLLGIVLQWLFSKSGTRLNLEAEHLVQMPEMKLGAGFGASLSKFFIFPDFRQLNNPKVWEAAVMIMGIASLETLLNLEAVDKLDPHRRKSPANRELIAQGVGNTLSGLIGGLPITSVVVRSSVGIQAGGQTKLTAIVHGVLLLLAILFLSPFINLIPLSALAGILIMTGYKLTSVTVFKTVWKRGWMQFIPFVVTIVAILATDLAIGTAIGLVVGFAFILWNNIKTSFHIVEEKHYNSTVLRIVVPQIASFLNKAYIRRKLEELPAGSSVILDARNAEFIDPDVLEVMKDYAEVVGPERGVKTTTVGFKDHYEMSDKVDHLSVMTKQMQDAMQPAEVMQILRDGNRRFIEGSQHQRDYQHQVNLTSAGQHPIGVVLSCIDSRTASEIIFDLGLGDVFSIRVAGNVVNEDILASLELGCDALGAKLILVLGHTHCGAVKAACKGEATGNLPSLINKIREGVLPEDLKVAARYPDDQHLMTRVVEQNVTHSIREIRRKSPMLDKMIKEGRVGIVSGIHNLETGEVTFGEMVTGR
jgi:MFS superfamily sulfate permease-like transporter